MTTLFGGSNQGSGQLASSSSDGSHAIDKSNVLAATAPGVITPMNPGDFGSIRTAPVVPAPRYFERDEADRLKELAKEKIDGARQSKRAYNALGKIEEADATVHKAHRKYEGVVADNELAKKKADGRLAKHLHTLRPGYARLGMGIEQAEQKADARISEIRARLTEAVR
ncbi:hypothetical protein [Microcoleus sp. A006_D1]|uniref:hypothetical protein n=1 Tax=Microcoleus sp. A006_D1 TaxID=3055267 RepID=UPI002FD6E727